MKEQVIQYLAFDVHRATVVASLRDESGAVVMRATVPTEAPAILLLIKNAGPRVHLAFEEGTQAQWLHDLVAPHAEKVVVCNTRGQNGSGNKNDRVDVDRMSEDLRRGALKRVYHGTRNVLNLKELVRATATSSTMPRESCKGSRHCSVPRLSKTDVERGSSSTAESP